MIKHAIKRSFFLTGKSFQLVLVLFILNLTFNFFSLLNPSDLVTTADLKSSYGVLLAFFIVIGAFMQSGALGYIKEKMRLENPGFLSIFTSSLKYVWRIVFAEILVLLAVLLVAVAFGFLVALPHVFGVVSKSTIILSIGLGVVFALIIMYLVVLMSLAPCFIVLKDQSIVNGLRQSFQMIRNRVSSAIVVLAFVLLAGFVGVALSFLGTLIENEKVQIGYQFLSALISAFWSIFYFGVLMSISQTFLDEKEVSN